MIYLLACSYTRTSLPLTTDSFIFHHLSPTYATSRRGEFGTNRRRVDGAVRVKVVRTAPTALHAQGKSAPGNISESPGQ